MKKVPTCFALLTLTILAIADQSVYSTKLGAGWADWSWAKVTKAGHMITVNVQKDWQGLYFHHVDQSSSGFTTLSFKVSGGAKGGQKLYVHATVKGKPLQEFILPALPAGKWTTITIPVKKLGLTGQAFDGFWIQAQVAGTYQVSDVVLKTK